MSKAVADIAKAALYRLGQLGLPPTPENYSKYYYEILGQPQPAAEANPLLEKMGETNVRVTEELSTIIDEVTHKTAGLASTLNLHSEEMRSSVSDLTQAEGKGAVLNLLGSILNTADAILTTTEDTHDGLMITRQALEQIQEELQETRRLVQEDPLTGTLNRRGLDIVLSREVARCKRSRHQLALAMVDIDHFKEVNDRHGHDAGDKMLQHMTTTIRSVLRESDVLARYGGEEFLIVFPDTDISGAAFVTDRLRNLVGNTPMIYEGRKIQATISAGLAQVKGDENGQSLIMRADAALYKAKNAGRNCVKIAD